MRIFVFVAILVCAGSLQAQSKLARRLTQLDIGVFEAEDPATLARGSVDQQLRTANQASTTAWEKIQTRGQWEAFRRENLARLRQSLRLPGLRQPAKIHVAGEIAGDGYKIQKLIYETRPQWFVTANLYLPATANSAMPGILLSHSHHSPKTQGELQDMGATWSRAGCAVLVPDHLGHGERRQHPFATTKDYEKEFPVSRQDYHFRYDASLQLYLCGESLMGWLVHDLMGGVDVLLAQPGIDPNQIILLGGVAGGGDPAAVTGALDERIACVGPFNFGGPQPETPYPLPDDAEASFSYAGSGSWESTRNLADSAVDGFLPWVIVGSVAPRRLIYGHEFSWDREQDPVYRRLEKIWSFYDASKRLGFAHGRGTLQGNQPEDSHCGNIGAFHRKMIHPLLNRWFAIAVTDKDEFSAQRDSGELACWTPELREKLQPKLLRQILRDQAAQQTSAVMVNTGPALRDELRRAWSERLGIQADGKSLAPPRRLDASHIDWQGAEAWQFPTDVGASVQLLLLPPEKPVEKMPAVIAVAQGGQRAFLRERSEELAGLLTAGVAVALVDVRHTGLNAEGNDRGQSSQLTADSASYLMLGRALLGAQVQDLRNVVHHVRSRRDIDTDRIALWGESFTSPSAKDAVFKYPRRVDRPNESDPLGAQLVLFTSLLEDDLCATVTRGGLVSYMSALETPFVQIPHGTVVRDVFTAGDLPSLAAALPSGRLLRIAQVDGLNRATEGPSDPESIAAWLLERLNSR